jgi:DNA-binding CsgD family transcriptional regulator
MHVLKVPIKGQGMKVWNISESASVSAANLPAAHLIDAIGVDDAVALSQAVLSSLSDKVTATHCSVFHYARSGSVRLVSGADRLARPVAITNAKPYIAAGIFKLDTNQEIMKDKVNNRTQTSLIHQQTVADLRAPSHQQLYFNADLLERVSLLHCLRDGSWAAINLYRQSEQGHASDDEIRKLAEFGVPIAHCVARHIELTSQREERSTSFGGSESALLLEIQNRYPDIPRRERQVMCGLLKGMTADGIACHLGLGPSTVITYKQRLFRRLEINTRAQLFSLFSRLM